jgi:hypothetical protein
LAVLDPAALSRRALVALGLVAAPAAAGRKNRRRPKETARCAVETNRGEPGTSTARIAMTFTATRSGRLRSVEAGVFKPSGGGGGGDWTIQIVSLSGGKPAADGARVLAAATIRNEQVPTDAAVFKAALGGLAIEAQEQYALVVNRPDGVIGVRFRQLGVGEQPPCSGRKVFTAPIAGPFDEVDDVIIPFAVFVD